MVNHCSKASFRCPVVTHFPSSTMDSFAPAEADQMYVSPNNHAERIYQNKVWMTVNGEVVIYRIDVSKGEFAVRAPTVNLLA